MEKYQITKTIRFKLEAVNGKANSLKANQTDSKIDLQILIYSLEKVKSDFKTIFFSKDENTNEDKFKSVFKIKYTWMRTFLKNQFYDSRNMSASSKSYSLIDLDYVLVEFKERWLKEWESILNRLKVFHAAPDESYFRKSETALTINQLAKRTNFEFIKEFSYSIEATQKPEIDDSIRIFISDLDKLQNTIKSFQKIFLPSQSGGLLVAGGSLNYYTINKTTKFEKQLSDIQENLKKKINSFRDRDGRQQFYLDQSIVDKIGLPSDIFDKTLDEVYPFLKKWKSDKKNGIIETAQKVELSKNDILEKGEYNLFHTSDSNLEKFIERTQKIGELAEQKNSDSTPAHLKKELKEKIRELKVKRGEFFNTPERPVQTQNYKKFCDFYKKIALKRGQELAKKRGIEKEKITAELLKYWCVILEKENSRFLYMIPIGNDDNIKKAKEYIKSGKANGSANEPKLYYFQSLTLRALRKLCFKSTDNTFKHATQKKDFPQYEQAMTSDREKIKFYQEVLKIWKEKGDDNFGLNLSNFNIEDLCNKNYPSLEEFEIALNKVCYIKKMYISSTIENDLENKFHAISFKIISYDIYHNNLKYNHSNYKNKHHTDIWKKFWESSDTSHYPLRLNPELKITWREPNDRTVKKYGKDSSLYDPKKKNRYLKEQFTLGLTFTENAHGKKFDFSFTDHKSIKNAIDGFNAKLAQENKGEWIYGIDRGTKELATLCLVKFPSPDFKNPEFPKLNLYKLKPNKYFFQDEAKTRYGQVDQISYSYNLMVVSNEEEKKSKIHVFQEEFQNQKNKYKTLVLKIENKWNLVYFNDQNILREVSLDKQVELIAEFNKSSKKDVKKINRKLRLICNHKGFSGPIKNISYYLNKLNPDKTNDWFEKIPEQESACFDLTTAKLIKGRIILNGDLMTFFKLKRLVAQRIIFDLFREGKITQSSEIRTRENKNYLLSVYNGIEVIKPNRIEEDDDAKNGLVIYRLSLEEKSNFETAGELIIEELNAYLKSLFEKNGTIYEPSIDKINHLRDSITANMIGIIKFLQTSYPIKSIALENLDEFKETGNKFITDHFIQSEVSIERRLEWSLYRSLQDLSLVPPNIKETILLKDEFQHLKFGVMKFIETKGTSSNCPACGNKYRKTGNHYICKDISNCGFSSKDNRKGLDPLINSDKVAAYNIAKRGLEILN